MYPNMTNVYLLYKVQAKLGKVEMSCVPQIMNIFYNLIMT